KVSSKAQQALSILRAPVNADGELGSFVDTGVSLGSGRDALTAHRIGSYLYAIGGTSASAGALKTVERALIDSDGKIGNFSRFDDVKLYWPRQNASSILLGSRFHILGGLDFEGFATNSLETALITAP